MNDLAGLGAIMRDVKAASENITLAENSTRRELAELRDSVNLLWLKAGGLAHLVTAKASNAKARWKCALSGMIWRCREMPGSRRVTAQQKAYVLTFSAHDQNIVTLRQKAKASNTFTFEGHDFRRRLACFLRVKSRPASAPTPCCSACKTASSN